LTPAADAESVFFPLSNGVLLALNTSDGKLQWKAEVGGDFSAALVADERSVYAATGYTDARGKECSWNFAGSEQVNGPDFMDANLARTDIGEPGGG
jgi:outer membrane protein assembly factor BamB